MNFFLLVTPNGPLAPTGEGLRAGRAYGQEVPRPAHVNPPDVNPREVTPTEVSPAEGTPEASFRESMASDDPEEWVRGMTRLSGHFGPTASPWVEAVLREFLGGEPALARPVRTRKLLADPNLHAPVPCESILIELLARPEYLFLPEVRGALRRVAADPQRRAALQARLAAEGATSPLAEPARPQAPAALQRSATLAVRLFEVLCDHDPAGALRVVLQRLSQDGDPLQDVLLGAVATLLDEPTTDLAFWRAWWAEHQQDAIVRLLLERQRRRAMDEVVQLWRRFLADYRQLPRSYQDLLLDGLRRAPEIQALAIEEIEQQLRGIVTERSALAPFLDRLLEIASDPASERPLRRSALRALRTMTAFREQPPAPLVEALARWIQAIPAQPAGGVGATSADSLEFEALAVAGELAAPVGDAIEGALVRQLDLDENGNPASWPSHRDGVVNTLLNELARVGPRPETLGRTLTLMERILASEPWVGTPREAARLASHRLAVRVIGDRATFRQAEPPLRARALRVLEGTLLRVDPEIRSWAVSGLGKLGMRDGIEPLARVVRDPGNGSYRKEAVKAIVQIGGLEAIAALRAVHGSLDEQQERELREDIRQSLRALVLRDPTLAFLEEFLLGGGSRAPWFEDSIRDPELQALLAPSDFERVLGSPEVLARWVRIRQEQCLLLVEYASARGPAQYRTAGELAEMALRLVGDLLAPGERRLFEEHRLLGRRGLIGAALSGPALDFTTAQKELRALLRDEARRRENGPGEALDPDPRVAHLSWLTDLLEAEPRPGAGSFIESLLDLERDPEVGFPFTPELRTRLKTLRVGDGVVESQPAQSPPPPTQGPPDGARDAPERPRGGFDGDS